MKWWRSLFRQMKGLRAAGSTGGGDRLMAKASHSTPIAAGKSVHRRYGCKFGQEVLLLRAVSSAES